MSNNDHNKFTQSEIDEARAWFAEVFPEVSPASWSNPPLTEEEEEQEARDAIALDKYTTEQEYWHGCGGY